MTEEETRKKIKERVKWLEERFAKVFKKIFCIDGQQCFFTNKGDYIRITGITSFDAIVIEYAMSERDAKSYMFDDGDLFYMDEYEDAQKMYEAMFAETQEDPFIP